MDYENYYKKYIEIFNNYVSTYDDSDSMIDRKRTHSYRVAIHAAKIAQSLGLTQEQIDISYICGLFHDIGRFEQAKQSHSFDDKFFQDHGDYGAKILEEGIAQKITDNIIIQNIIICATKYHNKYAIGEVTSEEELYCMITRDADKIDIMEYQINEIDGKFPLDDKVVENIYKNKLCKNGEINNSLDHLLRMMSFIFDMHYEYSYNYIVENGIVDKKIKLIKEHSIDDTTKVIECINNYLSDKKK